MNIFMVCWTRLVNLATHQRLLVYLMLNISVLINDLTVNETQGPTSGKEKADQIFPLFFFNPDSQNH